MTKQHSTKRADARPPLPSGLTVAFALAMAAAAVLPGAALAQPRAEPLARSPAAASASAQAQAGLGFFQRGEFSNAYQAWHDAAGHGDTASALYLGVMHDTGFGVPQDERAALEWYRRAAASGSATAMFNAAVMYDAGRGTAKDPRAAISFYEQASQNGVARAEFNLGLIYEEGAGVSPDRAAAVRLFRAAANHGVAAATDHLRALGQAAPPRRRADAGAMPRGAEDPAMEAFRQAQSLLLARGAGRASEAVNLFRRAAEIGDALAAYNLGYCYEHGIGVATSREQALSWYLRSAGAARDTAVKQIAQAGAQNLMALRAQAQR